ncbi:MAG TPA: YrhB domain-containing protein [Oculatellaceae cyanobacterium]|jgi:hypothetical protein
MEYQAAKKIVFDFINTSFDSVDDDEYVIIDDEITATEFGWVFSYQSKKFLETNELIYAVVGNSPIIFDNRDDSIHITGTSHDITFYIEQHRNNYIPESRS